ncbi:MAG TPA: hypothetical protein VGK27_06835 [Candidatus Deferrimicrobiaceae bacterium]
MSGKDDLKAKLRQKSQESAQRTDALLAEEYESLNKATKTDLEALRPKITDQASYDQFIAVIEEANAKNMDLASLQTRLESCGAGVAQVAKAAVKFLSV